MHAWRSGLSGWCWTESDSDGEQLGEHRADMIRESTEASEADWYRNWPELVRRTEVQHQQMGHLREHHVEHLREHHQSTQNTAYENTTPDTSNTTRTHRTPLTRTPRRTPPRGWSSGPIGRWCISQMNRRRQGRPSTPTELRERSMEPNISNWSWARLRPLPLPLVEQQRSAEVTGTAAEVSGTAIAVASSKVIQVMSGIDWCLCFGSK